MKELETEAKKYPNIVKVTWAQEEHRNQGAWNYSKTRINIVKKNINY